MEFIVQGEKFEKRTLGTFYSGKNYTGESQELGQGLYNYRQLTIGNPQSMKLAEHATFLAVEKADGTGVKIQSADSLPDLSSLQFVPALFTLVSNIAAYKGSEQVAVLNPGGYDLTALTERGADRLVIPEGLIARFGDGEDDPNAKSFKEGETALTGELLKFSRVFVLVMWNQTELSEAELAMVAGGGKDVCGGKVCAANISPADVCGAKVCAVAVLPLLPVSI
jgi:hypothetical protein